jgi:hypothetical protein
MQRMRTDPDLHVTARPRVYGVALDLHPWKLVVVTALAIVLIACALARATFQRFAVGSDKSRLPRSKLCDDTVVPLGYRCSARCSRR